jgi:DNA-binding NarL/FixJ family response regulator
VRHHKRHGRRIIGAHGLAVPESTRGSQVLQGYETGDEPYATYRQLEILWLLGCGWPTKNIANALGISGHTVRSHLDRCYLRLQLPARSGKNSQATRAYAKAWRMGLFSSAGFVKSK